MKQHKQPISLEFQNRFITVKSNISSHLSGILYTDERYRKYNIKAELQAIKEFIEQLDILLIKYNKP